MYDKGSIAADIARCLYEEDRATYEENGTNHISGVCFESIQTVKDLTLDFITSCITTAYTNALIGFSERIDQAPNIFGSILALKMSIPFIPFTAEYGRRVILAR